MIDQANTYLARAWHCYRFATEQPEIWLIALLLALSISGAAAQSGIFQGDYNLNVNSIISVNNTTSVSITSRHATVYSIEAFNNSTTLAYLKLYNGTATCGSGTPTARYMIPFGATSSGGVFSVPNINGDAYVNGRSACITTGIADNDTGAPAAKEQEGHG